MKLTLKQKLILKVISNRINEFDIDLYELLSELPYQTSKESIQFSIRHLIKKEVIEKKIMFRRDASRCVLNLTELGKEVVHDYI